ncbi:MAG: T9SS type A sorting domain-containing protein [Sphingobacteriales bacterium]|nr:MAG: T9SS type A sorting domain-containing protein [Sphingobacteriales bacterium]
MDYNFTRFMKIKPLQRFALSALSVITLSLGAGSVAKAQYCIPGYGIGCTSADDINSFSLTGQAGSNISDLNTGCGPNNGYEDRTTVIPAVDLMQGGTYSGTVTTSFSSSEFYRIWIDFDDNNSFDPGEALTGNVGPFGSGNPSTFSITLPISAPVGVHRMRVRLVFSIATLIDPCNTTLYTFGETHDYLVNVVPAPPCTGAPALTGVTPAGPINSCAGATQTLNVGLPIAGGYLFQWQTSTNGGATWTNVGTNSTSYSFTVTGNALYQVEVTCTNSGQSTLSNTVAVNAAPPVYTGIPYVQDFETWTTYCSNSDIPDGTTGTNWTNTPSTGDNSWRREDQGATANWSSPWGAYIPPSYSGSHSARFPTDPATIGLPGNLDLYLDCSAQTGDKALYFYHINDGQFGSADSLTIWLSTNGGSTFSQIGGFDTALNWKRRTVPIASNSAQTILRFQANKYNWDFTDMGIDSVYIAPPCNAAPVAGIVTPGGPISGCPGTLYVFNSTGTTMAGNLIYQWQESINGGVTWTNVTTGSGFNTMSFSTPALYDTIRYRMYVVCQTTGQSDTTVPVILNITSPLYAALPYSEGFESWMSFCDVNDVPSLNWLNTPATGDMSWRRNDDGGSANWFSPTMGAYAPASMEGNHSARFHSSTFFFWMGTGDMDLFVDCSAPGNKELQFYYINPSGFDSLNVFMSTDGGATFNHLEGYMDQASWGLKVLNLPSTSAQTVIKFRGLNDVSDDLGIDYVRVLLPCNGTPVAGTVDSLLPCSGEDFNLSLNGTTAAGGLVYQWQESPDGVTWTNLAGGNLPIVTTNITTPTWFRAIVSCGANADTSDGVFFDIAPFYYCYCNSAALESQDDDIGNFNVRRVPNNQLVFNNGFAVPLTNNSSANKTYSNFTGLAPIQLYRDSTYKFTVTQINSGSFFPSNVAVYIDLDQNGVFDPINEQVFLGLTSNTTSPLQQVNETFTIPSTAEIGLTGVRVVLVEAGFNFPDPCIVYNFGETEDYLAYIGYPPCDASATAGMAHISDTILCPGFAFTLTDTTHQKFRGGLQWNWQSSPDNVTWTDVPGTDSLDVATLISPNGSTYYRLRMLCTATNTSTFSNEVHLTIKPAYECYCSSFATGGPSDMTDLGAFSIGNYIFNGGGPHLNNPLAVQSYSAYDNLITLYTDSTYDLAAYHIIKDNVHQDAKITLFIDFNNNFVYDIPEERVWTTFSSSSNIFLSGSVSIPTNAIKDNLTGMRLIINNDMNPNIPSDEACGTYTSGETEDFIVKIKDKSTMGVGGMNGSLDFGLFPNPSNGKFTLRGTSTSSLRKVALRITTITGQLVYQRDFAPGSRDFATEVDLSEQAKGIYLVELNADGARTTKKLVIK